MAKKATAKTLTKPDAKETKEITDSKKTSTVQKSKKEKKDKVKSKKSLTPYFKFMKEQRPVVAKQHPELSNKEMIIELAKRWKSLPLAEKDKFKDK